MKKVIAIALSLVMVLSMAACGSTASLPSAGPFLLLKKRQQARIRERKSPSPALCPLDNGPTISMS